MVSGGIVSGRIVSGGIRSIGGDDPLEGVAAVLRDADLAIVNLEARVPLTASIRAVPFYDGGNVFRRIGEIFNPPDVPANDVVKQNLRALWTHTAGLGLRIKTPIGGEFAIDYGYLLNPPRFLIPQTVGPNAIYQLKQGHFHFRFSQAF